MDDARYMVHEIAEVRELQRTQQQTGFDYIGANYANRTKAQQEQWRANFTPYFLAAHSIALIKEYQFLSNEILRATNQKIKWSYREAAAMGGSRDESSDYMIVSGFALKDHPDFSMWKAQGQKRVEIGTRASRRLRLLTRIVTQVELLQAVKRQLLASPPKQRRERRKQ